MKKNSVKSIADIVMYFLLCFLAGTGLLVHYKLVPGFEGGHGLTLFGLDRHEWGEFHLYAAYGMIALAALHLFLNYAFIKNIIANKKTWLVTALGIPGLLIILFFLFAPIERSEDEGRGRGRGHIEETRQGSAPEH